MSQVIVSLEIKFIIIFVIVELKTKTHLLA